MKKPGNFEITGFHLFSIEEIKAASGFREPEFHFLLLFP